MSSADKCAFLRVRDSTGLAEKCGRPLTSILIDTPHIEIEHRFLRVADKFKLAETNVSTTGLNSTITVFLPQVRFNHLFGGRRFQGELVRVKLETNLPLAELTCITIILDRNLDPDVEGRDNAAVDSLLMSRNVIRHQLATGNIRRSWSRTGRWSVRKQHVQSCPELSRAVQSLVAWDPKQFQIFSMS
ncbi:hypothetical protein C8R44DRAFT_728519 [Mycena epipterygia]|nr:hypothetical protein C8R44DRAFT_728519 [Mycena epipterygia]